MREGLPEGGHQRAGAEHEIDLVLSDGLDQVPVQLGAGGAELQHVAEHGDAASMRAKRRLA